MVNPLFLCGTFHHDHHFSDDSDQPWIYRPSTPRRSRKGTENPYSSRGLDKFSALLADLESKKQQIYSQCSPQEISLVRFVFPDSKDCVPVVVKKSKIDDGTTNRSPKLRDSEIEKPKCDSDRWRWDFYPLIATFILILMLLAVFGRSISILFTCIWWYSVPLLKLREKLGQKNVKRSKRKKKKEYVRGLSDGFASVAGAATASEPPEKLVKICKG